MRDVSRYDEIAKRPASDGEGPHSHNLLDEYGLFAVQRRDEGQRRDIKSLVLRRIEEPVRVRILRRDDRDFDFDGHVIAHVEHL